MLIFMPLFLIWILAMAVLLCYIDRAPTLKQYHEELDALRPTVKNKLSEEEK